MAHSRTHLIRSLVTVYTSDPLTRDQIAEQTQQEINRNFRKEFGWTEEQLQEYWDFWLKGRNQEGQARVIQSIFWEQKPIGYLRECYQDNIIDIRRLGIVKFNPKLDVYNA